MAIVSYLCDLKTGTVLAELPLGIDGIERTVGQISTGSVTLDVHDPACPVNWSHILDPLRSMIIVCDGDRPIQGYLIGDVVYGDAQVQIPLESLESAADQVNVRDHEFYAGEDAEVDAAIALCRDVLVPSWGFEVAAAGGDVGAGGADHIYSYSEDRTVFSALSDLMGTEGGPEWGVRLAWEDDAHRRIIKTIAIGAKFGSYLPEVVIDDAYLTSRTRTVRRGGTLVVASSDGSGTERPMSADYVDADALNAGVPKWEIRQSVTAVDDPDLLDRIAASTLLRERTGVSLWEVALAATEPGCPRAGHDFDAGDTIVADIGPGEHDPDTWRGPARLLGWKADVSGGEITQVTPVLWQEDDDQ